MTRSAMFWKILASRIFYFHIFADTCTITDEDLKTMAAFFGQKKKQGKHIIFLPCGHGMEKVLYIAPVQLCNHCRKPVESTIHIT